MPQQLTTAVENNFTKGLITEATGLNFPENAATDTDNCTYTLIGDVTRREGIDYEVNFQTTPIVAGAAIAEYKWNNAGGDGQTQVAVVHTNNTLNFWLVSSATNTLPCSKQLLTSTVTISNFAAQGQVFDQTKECQFSDGNGYLFVFHPSCDPFFCSIANGNITATLIPVQIRDFVGLPEANVPVNSRPTALTNDHLYNLTNQGWTSGSPWSAISVGSGAPAVVSSGTVTFTVQSGLSITLGDLVSISTATTTFPGGTYTPAGTNVMSGSVNSYSGTTLVVNITGSTLSLVGTGVGPYQITPYNHGYINTWNSEISNYPSNADVWWYFKDNTDVFNPATTVSQVSLNSGQAPQGHFILSAWNINRTLISGISGITPVTTASRPTNGAFYAGRVWYTGVNGAQQASGDVDFYTWTENIYFSTVVLTPSDFGQCYQTNDPTSENLFDLLPTDGGVITIPGTGSIYKLFPIQNGLLVFASNGVWFVTGSQGIGFAADDYTITKISAVPSISGHSFVDVLGLPYFWNEDGIYMVSTQQGGGLAVEPITVGTIETFYDNIPTSSKHYVRGAYHPINYEIQWIYNSLEQGSSVTGRYKYDKILCYNTYNKAFFPYTISKTGPSISGILYISYPGGTNSPDPDFKYIATNGNAITFADQHDETYVDWKLAGSATNFNSYFVTGYKLRGQGIKKFQPQYIQMYSRTNGGPLAYYIQGIWDYSNNPNNGRWSVPQLMQSNAPMYDTVHRRHKLRGHGYALQFKVFSVTGQPFDIQGWAVIDTVNQGA